MDVVEFGGEEPFIFGVVDLEFEIRWDAKVRSALGHRPLDV